MFRRLNRIKGIIYDSSLYKRLVAWSNDGRGDDQTGYFRELLEDLNSIENDFVNLIPWLKNKIEKLKLQVRYILPYVASGLVTVNGRYDKVKRRFRRRDCLKGVDEFVDHMMKQTLLIKADATQFYCSAAQSEYDYRKSTSYVLENLSYALLETDRHFDVKELVKDSIWRLRFITTFRMLVEKWKFIKVCNKEKLDDIYKKTDCIIREAAYVFRLFTEENTDAGAAHAMNLEFTDLAQKTNECQLQAKSVYFEIMESLGLTLPGTCPVKCETLSDFIVSQRKILMQISNCHCPFIDSKENDIQNLLLETDFLKTILLHIEEESLEHGKLNAVSTHVDSLAHEAESIFRSISKVLENPENQDTMLKVLDLAEKVKLARSKISEMNRKDVLSVYCSIDDFMKCFRTQLTESIWYELGFLRTLLRCTERWSIESTDYPGLDTIRINIENVVRKSWWDFRRVLFIKCGIGNVDKEHESLCSYLLKNITVNNQAVKEVCAKIKVLNPSTPSCQMSTNLGMQVADTLCSKLRNLRCCNSESFSEMKRQLDNELTFLGYLREITATVCSNDKRRTDLLTHLEDLTERAACLSYLQLVGDEDQTMSFSELLLQNEEPEPKIYVRFIDVPIWELADFKQRIDEVMLQVVLFLIRNLRKLITSENLAESLEKELIVMRCVLTDPLLLHYEQKGLDELFKEIGAEICELGMIFCHFSVNKYEENIRYSVFETFDRLKGSVRKAYLKYAKLSPSMLPKSELGLLEVLLANLSDFKKDNPDSAESNRHLIDALTGGLVICSSFLRDNPINRNEQDGKLKDLTTLVMNIARKIENVMDTFEEVPEWYFKMQLTDVMEELKLITEELPKTRIVQNTKVKSDIGGSKEISHQRKGEEVIGEDEAEKLIKQICSGPRPLMINSIVGMPGSGKTTLAKKVYEAAASSFHTRAWCYVSQTYERRELLQTILNQINGPSNKLSELRTEDLAQKLYQCLLNKKNYLIVLDDIWAIEAWSGLKNCFPPGNNGSRILLTSRFKPIGSQLCGDDGACLQLQPLSIEKSWHLLEKTVFGLRSCPIALREVGKKIAKKCSGLPLSLVVIAGVLENIEETEEKWKQVEEGLSSIVENQDGIHDKLELSYNHLSVCMKQCFLYCGAFLRGKEMPRSKLARLWVAEKFIEETQQQTSLEDAAESCLRDLVDRSLLMVTKTGSGNRIQKCRMHDLLRDFCIQKAEDETFLHIVHRWDSFPKWHRRICFRRPTLYNSFTSTLSTTARTRSLLFIPYLDEIASIIIVDYHISKFENYKLLKVLDMECIDILEAIPESITRLTLLRYLAMRGKIDRIPPFIGSLVNLETLVFRETTGKIVHVPDTIFDLKNLRHLLVSDYASIISCDDSSSLDRLQSLETPIFCRCAMCDKTIARIPNLQKLRCVFEERSDESINCNAFPDLSSLGRLEILKLIYSGDYLYQCQLSLPWTVRKLTLSKFRFPWSEMETIAALPQLESLKLKDGAFKGKKWVTSAEFPSLKHLSFEELDIEEWEASEDDFPILERLAVRNCNSLKAIPSEFSEIDTLISIEVLSSCVSIVESVEEIEKSQRNSGNSQFKIKTTCIELEKSDVVPDSPAFEPEVYTDFVKLCRDPFGMVNNMGA
ncbi:hypothetical protein vseg_012092 [Gypsophila vaccaria]